MNIESIYHEAKSRYAYLYDKDTVHLRIRTKKDDIKSIKVIYGDPFFWGPRDDEPDSWEWKIESSDNKVMKKELSTEFYDYFFISIKPTYLRMKYAFIIDEQYLYGSSQLIDIIETPSQKSNLLNYFNFPFLNEEDMLKTPSWIKDQIWYSIFPERFKNGDESTNPQNIIKWGNTDTYSNDQRFGGDLRGIINSLDYLNDLGINGIYMTPIFKADSSHKYDTIDYYQIDPSFGTNQDFKELVTKAHQLGIKIMLDAVFNHSGINHPFFIDVIKNGKASKYYDCFYVLDDNLPVLDVKINNDLPIDRDEVRKLIKTPNDLNYRTFAFTPFMPKLKTSNKIMKDYLLDVTRYWIEEYNIDGWRLDVSNEVSHEFWRDFRKVVKSLNKEAYIVGENWDNSYPWLMGDQFDSVMNYEFLFPMWNYFGTNIDHQRFTSSKFVNSVNKVLTDYPKNILESMYNLVDSHDTTRILEICGNDINRAKLPYLFMFTLPGAPSIFYGGEVGLTGKHDPDNRRCMIWDKPSQNSNMLNHIKTLIRLRKNYHDLRSTNFNWLVINDSDNYIIYQKDSLTIIINNGDQNINITLPATLQNKSYIDIYNDNKLSITDSIKLNPTGFLILKNV